MPRTSILYDKRAAGRDYVDIDMSFAPNGSSAVSATSIRGKGIYSVARTGAGAFTITFNDDFKALVSASATIQKATAGDQIIQLGTFTAGTSSARATMTLTVWDISDAAAADIAADANNRIHCRFVFRKSDTTP